MSARSSAVRPRLRPLTTVLGVLGALEVVVAWVALYVGLYLDTRAGGKPTTSILMYVGLLDVALAILGAFPFVLVSLGRPRRPAVSLVVALALIGLNSYFYSTLFASDSSTRGLYAVGAVLYSWVVWGAGMVIDNWRRRPAPAGPPPRPDPVDTDRN